LAHQARDATRQRQKAQVAQKSSMAEDEFGYKTEEMDS